MWRLARALLFSIDPERAHRLSMWLFTRALKLPFVRSIVKRRYFPRDPLLRVKRFGLELASPVGLAAGFDKDAEWFNDLAALGFGFVEVGTVTAKAQPGNPRPRLFRLPLDSALINRFGFNSRGLEAVDAGLRRARIDTVLGINIGKSKDTPNEEAAGDYARSLSLLWPFGAYFVVNVSSPNTAGLRDLQNRDALTGLLKQVMQKNRDVAMERQLEPKPVFVKIAPDLADEELDTVADLAVELGIAGIVATNTTVSREGLKTPADEISRIGAGGLSGAPLRERSRNAVRRIYRRTGGKILLIGAGGVSTADDAWEMLRAGASLVEVYTGFIYGGPAFVRGLNDGLAAKLRERKITIDELVGEAARAEN